MRLRVAGLAAAVSAAMVALVAEIATSRLATGDGPTTGCALDGEVVWLAEADGVGLTSRDLASPAVTARFQPVPAGSLGFQPAPIWLRFRIAASSPVAAACAIDVGYTAAEHIDLFRALGDRVENVGRSGTSLAYADWPVKAPTVAFEVAPIPAVYFVRIASTNVVWPRISIMSASAFAQLSGDRSLGLGIYYGLLLIMILYNAVIFVATRGRTYAYYVLFEVSMFLLQAADDRTAFRYLWPGSPVWAQRSEQVLAAAAIVSALLLTRAFLDLPRHAPRLGRTLAALGALCAALGAAALGLVSAPFLAVLGLVFLASFVGLIAVVVVMARRGTPGSRVFAVAWTPVVIGGFAAVVSGLGFVPDAIGFVALKVGSATEATLLALALAGRINELRRERERAMKELLTLQTSQREVLEQRVTERTQELTRTLAALRDAQERLVRRERVATLAGMVAGVAHEVGNPLNFAQGGAASLDDQLARVARAWEARNAGGDVDSELPAVLSAARRALALIHSGHRRIGKIMDNLRGYMQERVIERRPIDLVVELEATLEAAGELLMRTGVCVERALGPLPPVPCREGELGQVFSNLITNACRAMPGGGVLRVSTGIVDQCVEVRFADTGPGVAAEHCDAIFEPFFSMRAEGAEGTHGDPGGSGLGLFISREIVNQHDGELLVLEGEHGAVFAVRLPLSAGTRESAPHEP